MICKSFLQNSWINILFVRWKNDYKIFIMRNKMDIYTIFLGVNTYQTVVYYLLDSYKNFDDAVRRVRTDINSEVGDEQKNGFCENGLSFGGQCWLLKGKH